MKNILAFFSISIFIFCSCTDTTTSTIAPLKAVVQAYLSPNQPIDMVVSQELAVTDTTSVVNYLNNLTVKIDYDGKTATLKSTGSGHYVSNFNVDSNKTYRMYFDFNGKTVEATTTVPSKPQNFKSSVLSIKMPSLNLSGPPAGGIPTFPDPVKLTWSNTNKEYYLISAKVTDSYPTQIFTGNAPKFSFRNNPTQENNNEIQPQQFQYFGNYILVLYRINGEYASLYDDNGSNSLNLTTPYTNVKNGSGIFTGIATDTIRFKVNKA